MMLQSSTLALSLLVVCAPAAWADGAKVFHSETMDVFLIDDNDNFVSMNVRDSATRSGAPNYFVEITAIGPDIGEFFCLGETLFGSRIADPLDIRDSANYGTAVFTTAGLIDGHGEPCRTDVHVSVSCASVDEETKFVCSTRSTHDPSTRIKLISRARDADCAVQVNMGNFIFRGVGERNGTLQVSHEVNKS
jgi:hypothetical protein